ncbi:hypothetical protein BH23BAC1_BH23BAC1_26740 [soil metagenome]
MATLKIKLRGQDFTQFSQGEDSGFDYYKIDQTFSVNSPTRSDVPEQQVEIRDDQIVELDFTDDTVWIGDNETLRELFPQNFKRGAVDSELFLPDELLSDEQDRSLVKKAGIKLLKVFSKKSVIKPAVRELARKVENRQLAYGGNDFNSVNAGTLLFCTDKFELTEAHQVDASKKYLLFIHGTGSSTAGSFVGFKDSDEWKAMMQEYEQILTFQHRTLTASPLENVQELLNYLPKGIELDIVTHSRGGLLADLLVRFCTVQDGPLGFDDEEREVFSRNNRERDLKAIIEIEKVAKQKEIKVNKIVRVACPANGTTLASKRLNFYLNVTFNLLGLATGQIGNPIFVAFKELIMAAVESKDDIEVLPGLEAMNPESPFIKALNYQASSIKISAPLFVVGGSSELSLQWKSLIVLTGKFFFREKNDLVVDTESMKWGALREVGKVAVFIERSGQIDHVKYFKTSRTRDAIKKALEFDGARIPAGFVALHLMKSEKRGALGIEGGRYKAPELTGNRPVVLLLPGIMGSNLLVGDDLIWIQYFKFLKGELVKLGYDAGNGSGIKADSLVETSYKRLGNHLSRNYDVIPFQFDWRNPLTQTAKELNQKVEELLKLNQPIKIIAHSMGGVLVRDFILNYPQTWKKLNELPGFRTLFLGSPLGGSYRIPYVLFGQDEMIRLLGKIDIKNSVKSLLEVFCNMPGILNLLPINKSGKHDFSDRIFWERLRTAFGDESWPIPDKQYLDQFGEYQKLVLQEEDKIDYSNIVYIAGQSRKKKFTVSSLDIVDNRLTFYATNAGDESVTWSSGIPKKLMDLHQFYYANVTHGSLSTEAKLFGAIDEILLFGSTSKLQSSLPKVRGEEEAFIPKPIDVFDLSQENVEGTLLGLDEAADRWEEELPLEVSVSHGNLKYAKFPVLAGHFMYDAILTTEKVIDIHLKGELSRLLQLGLYPGPIGTNQIVLSDNINNDSFRGGVIVGLGVPGELTGYQLTNSIEKGIARYLTILNQPQDGISGGKKENGNGKGRGKAKETPIGISVIAIANTYGGLSTDSSVRAIILGIQKANRQINTIYEGRIKVIEEVEIIELFQDRALSILKAIKRFEQDDTGEFNIVFKGKGLNATLGRLQRIPYDNSADWWTRISVVEDSSEKKEVASGDRRIRMAVATSGASEKVETLRANTRNLENMLQEMTHLNQFSPDIAKTMFELLIPLPFKEEMKRQSNISWVLDKRTAAFPWEMLQEDTKAMPLCINSGMVRQLATNYYRRNSTTVREMNAFIVGDPNLKGFAGQLPGARREGELVTNILRQQNFDTESLINSTPSQIILKLFTKNYKIIHLAGHGVFHADPDQPTGMLIGPNSFLSAQEIAQMSTVPELVFVNCCYLGQMDGQAEEYSQNRNRLAANIGTQLIENGVKAVIVAGWAVDDTAALEFCEQFYKCMFEGLGFGEAVRNARKKIYEAHRSRTNTWGAFQCYGDPFYKLIDQASQQKSSSDFIVEEEVEIELQNLAQQMETNEYEAGKLLVRMQEIERELSKRSIQNDRIYELMAGIYAGLELYEEAVRFYDALKKSKKAGFSFKAMEQCCNVGAKNIVREFNNKTLSEEEALKRMEQVIEDLKALIRFGANTERLSLLGSAYKRKLVLLQGKNAAEIKECLELAIAAYQQASHNENHQAAYPLTNWLQLLQIDLLAKDKGGVKFVPPKARQGLEEIEKKLNVSEKEKADFWSLSSHANIQLSQLMMGPNAKKAKEVIESYEKLWRKGGHQGHKAAELEHLDILLVGLRIADNGKGKEVSANIEKIKEELVKKV